MEIEPISSTSNAADRWLEHRLHQQQVQRQRRATRPDGDAGTAPPSEVAADDPVDVEVVEHPGTGAQTVRIVEAGSGRVISQIPPEQVLDLVAALIALNERNQQGGAGHGEQR